MKILHKTGYKTLAHAQRKLERCINLVSDASVGLVMANADGTFTPVVYLREGDLSLAVALASENVQVIG